MSASLRLGKNNATDLPLRSVYILFCSHEAILFVLFCFWGRAMAERRLYACVCGCMFLSFPVSILYVV
jgi:hypothetical protein